METNKETKCQMMTTECGSKNKKPVNSMAEYRVCGLLDTKHDVIYNLARQCPSMDVYTDYTYWFIMRYFGDMAYVLTHKEKPIGYILAVDTGLYVVICQMCILKDYRGLGLSEYLVDAVVPYAFSKGKCIEFTVDDKNDTAYNAMVSYCQRHKMTLLKKDNDAYCHFYAGNMDRRESVYQILPNK